MAKLSVTDPVPKFLRNTMEDPELIYPLLANMLDGDADEVFQYIIGAAAHQTRLPVKPEDKRWFKVKVKEVRVIERTIPNTSKLLGKKAEIVFDAKGDGGKIEEQSIPTGWTEYHGFNPEEQTWEVALANTIADEAERLVGKDAYVCKYLYETGRSGTGGRVRQCIGIREAFGKSDDSGDRGSQDSSQSSGRSGGRSRRDEPEETAQQSVEDEVNALYDSLKGADQEMFKDDDLDEIIKIVEGASDKTDVEDGIIKLLDLKDDDINNVRGTKSLADHAVEFFLENV